MTKFKNFGAFMLLLTVFGMVSCEDDNDSDVKIEYTLGDIVFSSAKSLNNALTEVSDNLNLDLNGSETYTIFAPTDAAFDALAEQTGFESSADLIAGIDAGVLSTILSYHVVAGENTAAQISQGATLTALSGEEITVKASDDGSVQLLDGTKLPQTDPVANVTNTNANANNGIIHFIDKVLIPPSLVETLALDIRPSILDWATAREDLSVLVAALDKAGLVETVAGLDSTTVLAPTNEAFINLLDSLGDDYESLDDFDNEAEIALLGDILTYHVLPGTIDLAAGEVETASGENSIQVVASGDSFEFDDAAAGANATIETSDIEARNGFVQIIDKVLLPQPALDFLALLNSADLATTVAGEAQLSVLVQALIATDLVDTFVDATNAALDTTATNFTYFRPATVFAPTDQAFGDLLGLLGEDYTGIDSFDTEEEIALLTDILLYHVVPGKITSGDLSAGSVTTASGSDIEVITSLASDGFVIGDATNDVNAEILRADLLARNGVAHVIDKVLLSESAIAFVNSLNEEEDTEEDEEEEEEEDN